MLSSRQVLDDYFPQVRAWLIQIAATMDRFDRAAGGDANAPTASDDLRLEQYRQAVNVLAASEGPDRAEKIQVIFSDPADYDALPYPKEAEA